MNISGVNSTAMQPGTAGMGAGAADQADPVSKDLRRQIEDLQKRLQELSANQEMPAETKMKKRQEMQKQISELEIQLRQHQMDVKREQARKKKESGNAFDELTGAKQLEKKNGKRGTGMSAGSMEALISADASMKQADVHGHIAQKADNRAGVLETEIALDQGRGGSSNIEFKKEELADTKALADQAASAQMESLTEANETVQDAAKEEQKDKDGKEEDNVKTENGQNIAIVEGEGAGTEAKQKAAGTDGSQTEAPKQDTFDMEMMGVTFSRGYQPVDVKL